MKKRFLLLCILLQTYTCFGQKAIECDCQAILDPEFFQPVSVLVKASGKQSYTIENNKDTEVYFTFHISRDSAGYFGVTPSSIDQKKYPWGWIQKGHVGIYARNYTPDQPLLLYRKPDKQAKASSIIQAWIPELYRVNHCQGKWLYVELRFKGKQYQGWIEPSMQCADPYTSCN